MNICIVNCFDTYEHRVDLLCDTFRDSGHKVTVLSSDFRHIEKIKRTERKKGFVFFETIPYTKNLSIKRMQSHIDFSKKISRYVRKRINRFDLFWVLIPPNSLAKEISKIKEDFPEKKLIFDLIDLWPETMPMGKLKTVFPFSYWKNLRDNHLKSADCIVTECDLYRKKLRSVLNGKKVYTLYLARPYQEYVPKLHLPNDKISLCYLGSINNIIDIPEIVRIIKQCQKNRPVELHIIGDGEKRNELIAKTKATGADVHYHGKVYDRAEKQYIFDGCHYGLNIMKKTVCVGLTMKSMDYMEFGLPIINNIVGDTWNMISSGKFGINIDSSTVLKRIRTELDMRKYCRSYYCNTLTTVPFTKRLYRMINEIYGF